MCADLLIPSTLSPTHPPTSALLLLLPLLLLLLFCCCSIQALMSAPNPDDPLDEGIAKHWKTNEVDALAVARQWTMQWAQSD